MSAWGQTIIIDGAKFVPNVSTAQCFDDITSDGIVTSILLFDNGGNQAADAIEARLNEEFVDKKYSELLAAHG